MGWIVPVPPAPPRPEDTFVPPAYPALPRPGEGGLIAASEAERLRLEEIAEAAETEAVAATVPTAVARDPSAQLDPTSLIGQAICLKISKLVLVLRAD